MAVPANLSQNPAAYGPVATAGATGSPFLMQVGTVDPTAASAAITRTDGTPMTLPKGARPIAVQNLNGGATGGTNPTIDIGTSGDGDGFANEVDADGRTTFLGTGALIGTVLTADTPVYAGVGASAATGGTVTFAIYYTWDPQDVTDLSGL